MKIRRAWLSKKCPTMMIVEHLDGSKTWCRNTPARIITGTELHPLPVSYRSSVDSLLAPATLRALYGLVAMDGPHKYRKLPEMPMKGATYLNGDSLYQVVSIGPDHAVVNRPKDGWVCVAHGPALYMVDDDHVELQWNYSTEGHFLSDYITAKAVAETAR